MFTMGFVIGVVTTFFAQHSLVIAELSSSGTIAVVVLVALFVLAMTVFGVRIIPNDRVGIVEKLWSFKGSVNEGRIMAFNGQAGYEAKLLRGGIHLGKWFWQYRIHRTSLRSHLWHRAVERVPDRHLVMIEVRRPAGDPAARSRSW